MFSNSASFGIRLSGAILLALFIASSLLAQSQTKPDQTRGGKPREYAKKLGEEVSKKRPPANRRRANPPAKYEPATDDTSPVADGVDVGVTFWQLREARKNDDPAVVEQTRIAKRVKGKTTESTEAMTPTRAKSETLFSDGDILRLTIEVPFESHIYLLNREQYADGTMSDPYLIFPGRQDIGGSAKGVPGKLIYIPNEVDYFEITSLNPDGPKKTAEVFTVLLSAQPLEELPPLRDDEENRKLDPQQFQEWEKKWGSEVWKFEKVGGVGAAITRVEKKAGASGGQLLTQADPEPQTVYHMARKAGETLIFTIPVRIRK